MLMTANANTGGVEVTVKVVPFLIIVVATAVALVSYPARAVTPEADFAARCAAPGVVLCNGLDADPDITSGMQPAADNTIQGSIDTLTKSSGAGSLRFRLRAGITTANIGGAWEGSLGKTFNVGDTIYVQWRQMVSPEYLSNNLTKWGSTIKQINIHGPSSTCQGAEFTTVTGNNTPRTANFPSMYTNCGIGFNTDPVTNILCDRGGCPNGILLQQGSSLVPSPNGSGYNCNYQNQVAGTGDGSGCFSPLANVWYTYFEKIFIGVFGGFTSTVDAYVAANGGPYKQFQRANQILFDSGRDNNFTRVRLETYMTELAKGGSASTVDAFVWYDELIVSTQPIAAPGVAPLPIPQNLRFTP
jgi:hypothetical protein